MNEVNGERYTVQEFLHESKYLLKMILNLKITIPTRIPYFPKGGYRIDGDHFSAPDIPWSPLEEYGTSRAHYPIKCVMQRRKNLSHMVWLMRVKGSGEIVSQCHEPPIAEPESFSVVMEEHTPFDTRRSEVPGFIGKPTTVFKWLIATNCSMPEAPNLLGLFFFKYCWVRIAQMGLHWLVVAFGRKFAVSV